MDNPEPYQLYEKISPQKTFTLQAKNVYTDFGSVQLLQNMNLNICEGEITVLLGQNGAGKTSAMSVLTGMCGWHVDCKREAVCLKVLSRF